MTSGARGPRGRHGRRGVTGWAVAAVLAVLVVLSSGTAVVATAGSAAAATGLRVLNWNIHGATGPDGVTSIDRVGDVIAEQNPDIVTLQEVHNNTAVGGENQWQELLDRFPQYEGHFARSDDNAFGGSAGNLILSRFPIAERLTHLLPQYPADSAAVRRSLGGARIDVNGTDLRVYTTHLSAGEGAEATERRQRQARDALDTMPGSLMETPMLFTGDLNFRPDGAVRPWIAAEGWFDVWTQLNANVGAETVTLPGNGDDARIDYVYASPAFDTDAARTVQTAASDHRPVVADVTIRDTRVTRTGTELAGARGEAGWANLAVYQNSSAKLRVCDNKADGWGVRAYVRAGGTLLTGADGAYANRCATFTTVAGTMPIEVTVRVCLYQGEQERDCRERQV